MIVKSVHGPVDLSKPENVVRGMVFERDGRRFVATRDGQYCFTGQTEHRFIGLDMREASAADVERLCCGAVFHDDHGGCGERCTLAIGDHAEHEDIAAGVRWKAREPQRPGVTWTYPDAGAVVGVDRAMVPAPTLRALLREFDGQLREHELARGVRVLAYVPDNAAARDLAKHLQSLGGTWHPGQRRVQWPGGSSLYMVGRYDENRVRGMRVDAIVGGWPNYESARATLDPRGLRLRVSGADAPAFWGEERRHYSGNVRSADTSRLAGYLEEVGFVGKTTLSGFALDPPYRSTMVMAGTPRRTSPDLLYADSVGGVPIGGARADIVAVAETPLAPRRVRMLVRDDESLRSDTPAGARTIVRLAAPDLSESEVDKVTDHLAHWCPKAVGASLRGAIEVVLGAKVFSPSEPAQSPPIDPRRTAWLDDVTRRLLDTRKAAASETATEHNAEALLLSKALRSALADVDRLPWDLADRKPLRAAAHTLCEMAEAATDGMGHDGGKLRPMLGEMLGILRASAHLPPATAASMAERTLGAARKVMPGRRGPRTYDHVHVYLNGKLLGESK